MAQTPLYGFLSSVTESWHVLKQALPFEQHRPGGQPFMIALCKPKGDSVLLVLDNRKANKLTEWPSTDLSAHERLPLVAAAKPVSDRLATLSAYLDIDAIARNAANVPVSPMFIRIWNDKEFEIGLAGGAFTTQKCLDIDLLDQMLHDRMQAIIPFKEDTGAFLFLNNVHNVNRKVLADTQEAADAFAYALSMGTHQVHHLKKSLAA